MAKSPVRIKLDPNRCDRCGACTRVCAPGALKVGPSYIYLDWRACDECMKCVGACSKGAITRLESSRKKSSRLEPARRASGRMPEARPTRTSAPKARSKPAAVAGPLTWTIAEAAALIAVAFAAFLGKDAVLGSAFVTGLTAPGRVVARALVLAVFYAVQLGALAFFARRRGSGMFASVGVARVRSTWRASVSAVGRVALLLLGTRVAAWVWGVAAQATGIRPPVGVDSGLTDVFGAGVLGLTLSILLVVIVAPLAEEMLFRGVLLSALGSRWGLGIALVVQAIVFAAYHFTPWLLVPTFVLGLACGWLTQRRGSLWPAVVLHALYNAVPVAAAFYVAR